MNNKILKLDAVLFDKIWGGSQLGRLKRKSANYQRIGESWEVSVHSEGSSLHHGKMLSSIIDASKLPYLIKLIDTSDNLSVQVHPDDEFAKHNESSMGKSECWIILNGGDSEAGIYLGIKEGITHDNFLEALKKQEDISKLLNYYKVSTGDFFFVPAGMVHAIGKDVFLLEIQQSSGITYRIWDWNRLDDNKKPRSLHIDKAMRVMNFDERFNNINTTMHKKNVFQTEKKDELIKHKDFCVVPYLLKSDQKIEIMGNSSRYQSLICLFGKLSVELDGMQEEVGAFESILLLNNDNKKVMVKALSENAKAVVVF